MPTPPRQRPLRRLAPSCGLMAVVLTALLACLAGSAGAAPAAAATAGENARSAAVTGGASVRVVRRARAAAARRVNPLAERSLYLEPTGSAARQADAWQGSRPGDAELVRWIAGQPQGLWLGEWHRDVRSVVARRMRASRAAGTVPVLVIYNIPDRDCGQHSGGGAPDGPAYLAWIEQVAAGIGAGPATVVLEPDALGHLACLPRRARSERTALMAAAVDVLTRQGGTAVYIDGGNPGWVSAGAMSRRLRSAGVARARGFALNVSSFETTERVAKYGRAISRRTGGSHFVVDTSRNGNGPDPAGAWCNPPGRALGSAPTTQTGDPLIDAFLWVKRPGESDGTCNGGPPAGTWWPEYALGLARAAQGSAG